MSSIKSSNINITDLDFDDVSKSLKEYLKGQTVLKDYDFEGSNVSILVDLLAYSAHTSAFNANMVASEMFLDTAQIRKNVVSRAKELGYTPASRAAAKATFDLTINSPTIAGETPSSLTISRGHRFNTVYDGSSYTFISLDNKTITPSSGKFTFEDLDVYQGKLTSDIYRFDGQVTNQRFPLLNPFIDTSTITVNVTSNNVVDTWAKAGDLTNITSTSKVFYIQENDDGLFEIYFGDNVIGASPKDGDQISISYLVTDSNHANGANVFSMSTSIGTAIAPNNAALLSGLEAEFTQGSIIGLGGAVVNPTGQTVTSSVGVLDPNDMTLGLTGVSASLSIGTITLPDIVVGFDGLSASFNVGTVDIFAYGDVDTGSNTSYSNVSTGSNSSYSDVATGSNTSYNDVAA